jgi:hypothetical protein
LNKNGVRNVQSGLTDDDPVGTSLKQGANLAIVKNTGGTYDSRGII